MMPPLLRLYGDWATKTITERYISSLVSAAAPAIRIALSLATVWTLAGGMDKPRLKTAALFGATGGFLTACELSPLLASSSGGGDGDVSPFASFAMNLLTFTSVLVGMAIGSLLPRVFMGVSLGVVSALIAVGVADVAGVVGLGQLDFPMLAAVLAVVAGGISCR
jgi:hypothetical protein